MIMPRFYYQRGKTSDRDWIEDKLLHIPVAERQEVADEYERKYMSKTGGSRGRANTWLFAVAKKNWEKQNGKEVE